LIKNFKFYLYNRYLKFQAIKVDISYFIGKIGRLHRQGSIR